MSRSDTVTLPEIDARLDDVAQAIVVCAGMIERQNDLLERLVGAATKPHPDDGQIALLRQMLTLLEEIASRLVVDEGSLKTHSARADKPRQPKLQAEGSVTAALDKSHAKSG